MNDRIPRFPFRWVLPVVQFVICLVILWPVRYPLLGGLALSVASYSPSRTTSSEPVQIVIPTLTPEQQQAVDKAAKIEDLRMKAPVVLDFPVVIAECPYIMAKPAKREWVPRGMLTEVWRAISWPFAGILFWWCAGRGIEALRSSRHAIISPRVTLPETIFAAFLVFIGIVVLVGAITCTPDDRRDLQFVVLLVGGMLWGILSSLTITARTLQWRIRKRGAAVMPSLA